MKRRETQVFEAMVGLADTLVSGFDVSDLFDDLVEECTGLLQVDQAGLLLEGEDGALAVMASTSHETHMVELLQLQDQEGPCLEAFRSREAVHAGPLTSHEAQQRWPCSRLAPSLPWLALS